MRFLIICRRVTLVAVLAMVAIGAFAADPPPLNGGGVTGLDLKAQLEKGLKARRPVEFRYIAQIVKLVEIGKLPRTLVDTTFVWARTQPTRQLQYFQFALQARVKQEKLPVKLPDLREQTVGARGQSGFQ